MKMTLTDIDDQIREVENRIAVERIALEEAVDSCTHSLRETAIAPGTLLALAGVGFAVGKVMFRGRPQPPSGALVKKAGMAGLLTGVAGTALSLAGSRWGTLATWAVRKYFSRGKAATSAASSAVYPPSVGTGARLR